ncbi:harpin-induced family protein [Salix suchowensis]|nr:harpin-induced family protein [Salix suchowensis]
MADRVYPCDDSPPQTTEFKPPPPPQEEEEDRAHHPQSPTKLADPQSKKPGQPPPGTYVIQIPKDQVYRVPPPENAQRFERLSRGKPSRSRCCCCLCWFLSFLAAFLFLLGLAAAILYLVFRPESPDYSIERVSISGFNLTSSGPISPAFNVTVRANNPNNKIGIYYEKGSSVNVYSDGVKMATGSLPVFYQDKNNVTVVVTSLKGTGIELTSGVRTALATGVRKGTVPFNLALRAPVKLKLGSVKTWKITVKVDCELTVDKLTASARIGSKSCDYGVDLW